MIAKAINTRWNDINITISDHHPHIQNERFIYMNIYIPDTLPTKILLDKRETKELIELLQETLDEGADS